MYYADKIALTKRPIEIKITVVTSVAIIFAGIETLRGTESLMMYGKMYVSRTNAAFFQGYKGGRRINGHNIVDSFQNLFKVGKSFDD